MTKVKTCIVFPGAPPVLAGASLYFFPFSDLSLNFGFLFFVNFAPKLSPLAFYSGISLLSAVERIFCQTRPPNLFLTGSEQPPFLRQVTLLFSSF